MKKYYIAGGLALLALAAAYGPYKSSVSDEFSKFPTATLSSSNSNVPSLTDAVSPDDRESPRKIDANPKFISIEGMSSDDIAEEVKLIEDRIESEDVIRRFNDDSVNSVERQEYSDLMSRLDDLKSKNLRHDLMVIEKAVAAYEIEHGKKIDEMREFLKQASLNK